MEMAIDTPSLSLSTSPPSPEQQMRTAESVRVEHQLVRVPLEALKSTACANHRLLQENAGAEKEIIAAAPGDNGAATIDHLTSLVSHLHGLKHKMEEGARAKELHVQRCWVQLDQLAAVSASDDGEWEDMRLKWILVDYMLRMSYYDTATKLAKTYDTESNDRFLVLFEQNQWDCLVDQFMQEFYKLYGMMLEPLLNISLQASLIALKTLYSASRVTAPKKTPYRWMAFGNWLSHCHSQSSTIRSSSATQPRAHGHRKPATRSADMYSTKALDEMVKKNDNTITCPRIGDVCKFSDLVKAYIS